MLDRDAALATVGSDLDLLRNRNAVSQGISHFHRGAERLPSAQWDAVSIEHNAHRLKGAIVLFGTGAVFQAAYRLQ